MRQAAAGFAAALVLVVIVTAGFRLSDAYGQRPVRLPETSVAKGSEIFAFSASLGSGRQQLTVIDPQSRVMSVYHVDGANGQIALQSVRNLHWDLQMDDFNGGSPSPREVRALVERR